MGGWNLFEFIVIANWYPSFIAFIIKLCLVIHISSSSPLGVYDFIFTIISGCTNSPQTKYFINLRETISSNTRLKPFTTKVKIVDRAWKAIFNEVLWPEFIWIIWVGLFVYGFLWFWITRSWCYCGEVQWNQHQSDEE